MDTSIIALVVSGIVAIFNILTFALNRKDKSNKTTGDDGYRWGSLDEKLANIEKTLAKIENKLDTYDIEIDEKIEKAIENHIKMFHSRSHKTGS